MLVAGAFLYFILPIAFDLKNSGELYFGGRRSLYHDTILSLSRTFAYHKLPIGLADVVFAILFILACAKAFIQFTRALRDRSLHPSLAAPMLFTLCLLIPVLQYFLLETSFPTERTALVFYPLLILVLVNRSVFDRKLLREAGLPILGGMFLLQLIYSTNFSHCYSWKFDSGSREVIGQINRSSLGEKRIRVGINYIYGQSIRYYIYSQGITNIEPIEVTKCWEYNLDLEELDPNYYGAVPFNYEMTDEGYQELMDRGLDYYYLDDFIFSQLEKRNTAMKVIKEFPTAGAKLIQMNLNNP